MPKSPKSINTDLYNLLDSRGFNISMKASSGKSVPVPEEADVFEFEFQIGDQDYGTVTLTIDGLKDLIVYFGKGVSNSNSGEQNSWVQFVKQIKKFAMRHQLGFKLKDMDRLEKDMKFRDHTKKLDEGYYGNKNTSYSDNGPASIKMILKHNKKLEEGDARYRYVERIFLENEMGERVLVPSTKPSVGRAFARHLAEGGQYNDERWKHISEITEDIKKLGGFVRATRTAQFNESVQRIVTEATSHYQTLRETMKRLASGRGYNTYFESWTPTLMEDQDTDSLTELFKHSTLDTRIESAIPVLSRLNIAITENTDIDMFETWADNIIDEALIPRQPDQRDALIDLLGPDSDFMPLGPDGSSAIGELTGILEDDELNDRLAKAAHRDPNRDAKPIITGWMSEQHGESYDEILDKIEPRSDGEMDRDESEPEPEVSSDKPTDELPDMPPMPNDGAAPADQSQELPDLPPLPPMKESHKFRDPNIRALKYPAQVNESLERIKRLSGL
jgi:hypothetical protein